MTAGPSLIGTTSRKRPHRRGWTWPASLPDLPVRHSADPPCPAPVRKIFRWRRRANQGHWFARLLHRGACARHERGVGCGGREWRARRARRTRTAKPCGPDAPTLASSSWGAKLLRGDGGKKARSPGRARY